ncbi:MAG: 50S ribosomal protein L4 [Kiritimatiellaeota bacterium]|jgi:large subunit ribosomal protein L4|nr:50S ribosomal protein L4 [Kiritimatiellota bacterium]
MSTLNVYGADGAVKGAIEVDDALLVLDRGEQAVRDYIVGRQAALRAGTASTLSKGEVAGSNKKPWKQKGTGRARAGLKQSPVWRGGGVAFGPKPRDFSQKINKKVAKLAYRRVLSDAVAEGTLKVVEALNFAAPKTKELVAVLKAFGAEKSALIVVREYEKNLLLAARNLPGVEVITARNASPWHIMRYKTAIATREGWEDLFARCSGGVPASEEGAAQ